MHFDVVSSQVKVYNDLTALDLAMAGDERVVRCLVHSQRGKLLRRMFQLRRLARHVGSAAAGLLELYTEVSFVVVVVMVVVVEVV